MTRDQILDFTERRKDALNRHDVIGLAALYAADCVVESPLAAGTIYGRQAVTKVHERLFEAFPDLQFDQDHVLIDGDKAAVGGTLTGNYTGGFLGLPPSGKPIRVPLAVIFRVADGEIVFERRIYDFTGMMMQIGVLQPRSAS
jgi:steroid delta-isomerase-like uncharacterized protein